METLDLSSLTPEGVAKLPEEVIAQLAEHRRLFARKLLEAGEVAGWAKGLTIRSAVGSLVEFRPYAYQAELLNLTEQFVIVRKSRQVGITLGLCLRILGKVISQPGALELFFSARQDTANEALGRILTAWEREVGAPGLTKQTESTLFFDNGAKVYSLPATERAALGHAATDLYLDEFANMQFADEIYEAAAPTIARGGNIFIVSTPLGQAGKYYDIWQAARRGENKFWPSTVHWSECPAYNPQGYSLAPAERLKKGLAGPWYGANRPLYSEVEWGRQFDCDFTASGDTFFNQEDLKTLEGIRREAVFHEGPLKIFQEPKPGISYVIGADVAEGTKTGDFSVAVVLEARSGEEVACLRGRMPPTEFAHRLFDLRKRGYRGVLAVERNGPGLATLEKLVEIDPILLYRASDGRAGWVTNSKTRPVMLSGLEEAVRNRTLRMHSLEFYQEATIFSHRAEGTPEAPSGKNDDVIFAAGIAWQVRKEAPRMDYPLPQSWVGRTQLSTSRTGY